MSASGTRAYRAMVTLQPCSSFSSVAASVSWPVVCCGRTHCPSCHTRNNYNESEANRTVMVWAAISWPAR